MKGELVEVPNTIDCNVWKFLAEGKNVILQTSLGGTDVTEYDIQISLMILSIIENSDKFPKGVGIFADEMENIVSRARKKSELRSIMIRVPKKYRKRNIWIIGVTQSPTDVDPAFVNQADILIYPRMDDEELKYLLSNSTINMKALMFSIATSLRVGRAPNMEWLLVFPAQSIISEGMLQTKYEIFFPLPCRGQYHVKAANEFLVVEDG